MLAVLSTRGILSLDQGTEDRDGDTGLALKRAELTALIGLRNRGFDNWESFRRVAYSKIRVPNKLLVGEGVYLSVSYKANSVG